MISLENKYFAERSRALRMGVDFTIPFDDWLKIWQEGDWEIEMVLKLKERTK